MHKFESLCKGIFGVFLVVILWCFLPNFWAIFATFCTTFWLGLVCVLAVLFGWAKIGVDVFASNYCKIWLGLV